MCVRLVTTSTVTIVDAEELGGTMIKKPTELFDEDMEAA
jgi:cobalamin biosynthesis protein CobT